MTDLLLIDDDQAVGMTLGGLLRQAGYSATHVTSAAEGLARMNSGNVDVVILDLRMPEMDGLSALQRMRESGFDTPVIMLTAHGTVDDAVTAMKLGASDFLMKPTDKDALLFTLNKVLEVTKQNRERPPEAATVVRPDVEIEDMVNKAARSEATVLIRGESGTGKEVTARRIHESSKRSSGPFVKIHCAAIPDHLLESELFGYEKGAFTGASSRKPGRFELAEGGTIFLDEIGDVSPAVQVKLLRVMQDREFERLGGQDTLRTNARFLAATHRDLESMVADGSFREDFFYRLNVIPIRLSPLRERRDEIRGLATQFCERFSEANGVQRHLSEEAFQALCDHHWPGNVRELQNVVERMVVLSDSAELGKNEVRACLPPKMESSKPRGETAEELTAAVVQAERDAIVAALEKTKGNRTQAARILGISRRSLYYKLDAYGL
ncbi:MAG: sigma-54 dependent transcriptional regulator [Myxococcota bacterium]